jgi:undecaprenyl pyrophosphate synthase
VNRPPKSSRGELRSIARRTMIQRGLLPDFSAGPWRRRAPSLSLLSEMTKEDTLRRVDSGMLYLTNRRMVLVGQRKSETTKLASIVKAKRYADGLGPGTDEATYQHHSHVLGTAT